VRVAVLGAGALGSVFGGFLSLAGHDVTLLGREWHLKAVGQNGLKIKGIWGEHLITDLNLATEAERLEPGFDLILITVKSYDTKAMARVAERLLAGEGLVLSLQNGLGNGEILERAVGRERCALGRVIFGAEITEPGEVEVTVCADDVVVGPVGEGYRPERIEAIKNVVSAIKDAGIPCRYSGEVQTYLWAKAMYNCALNPLGALLGVNYGALADYEYTRNIMDNIIEELFVVARARGIDLPWPEASAFIGEFYSKLIPPTRNHRASMLQDIERGRRTEIDALNGQIVEYGREVGVSTPVNETITNLIKFLERKNK